MRRLCAVLLTLALLTASGAPCSPLSLQLALSRFLFQSVPADLGALLAACPDSGQTAVVAALVTGADARDIVSQTRLAATFTEGWPLGALLVALGHGDLTARPFSAVEAVHVLVDASSVACAKSAAVLSLALSQLPVLSEDIPHLIETSEAVLRQAGLTLPDCPQAVQTLARLEAAGFFAKVDANEFYVAQDARIRQYAAHQVPQATQAVECLGGQATGAGVCERDWFLGTQINVGYWESRGVELADVDLAFKQVTDLKLVRLTKVGQVVELAVPKSGHYFGRLEPELKCLLDFVKKVDAQFGLPDFEFVLNHGDLPLSRRVADKPPLYDFGDGAPRTPVPLLSLVTSPHFHDMLFPNVCRPQLGNLTAAGPAELHDWTKKKEQALYRGTDRGAVNWRRLETPMQKLKSLRKVYEEAMEGHEDLVDFALLDDDLFDAAVVAEDAKFVPFEKSQQWKYIVDIPGNGYSGSLKQKLTSSSAVFVVSRPEEFPDHLPVTEHFYFGLQAFKHYVPVHSPDDLVRKVQWARDNDDVVQEIRNNANRFMDNFQWKSECYVYLLIQKYAKTLRFEPTLTRDLRGVNHYQVRVTAQERESNVRKCTEFI